MSSHADLAAILAADAPALLPLLEVDDQQQQHGSDMTITTRSSPDFGAAHQLANLRIKTETVPLAVVRPRTEAAVARVIAVCARASPPLPVVARSCGHDLQGRSSVAGGVVIDMRSFDSIEVLDDGSSGGQGGGEGEEEGEAVVRVGPGVTLRRLTRFLAERSLFAPTGTCAGVGYVNWCLGGGYGVTSGTYGLGVDQILGARVVTSSGQIITTDDAKHKDLLWALRGAGNGNFGIVTELRTRAYRRSPRLLAGVLLYPDAGLRLVLAGLATLPAVPDQLTLEIIQLPTMTPGDNIFSFIFTWTEVAAGEGLERGQEWLDRIVRMAAPVANTVSETTFDSLLALLNPGEDDDRLQVQVYLEERHVAGPSAALADILTRAKPAGRRWSPHAVTHVANGRALHPGGRDRGCMAARPPYWVAAVGAGVFSIDTGSGVDDADAVALAEAEAWTKTGIAQLEESGLVVPGVYAAFSSTESVSVEDNHGKEGAARLRELKRRYDPQNLFSRSYPRLV